MTYFHCSCYCKLLRYFVHHPFNICKPQSKLYTLLAFKPIPAKLTGTWTQLLVGVNTVTQVTNDNPGCKISYGKNYRVHYNFIVISFHAYNKIRTSLKISTTLVNLFEQQKQGRSLKVFWFHWKERKQRKQKRNIVVVKWYLYSNLKLGWKCVCKSSNYLQKFHAGGTFLLVHG